MATTHADTRPWWRALATAVALSLVVAVVATPDARAADGAVPAGVVAEATATPTEQRDTAEEAADGSAYLTSTDLELVVDGARGAQTVGLRFPDLAVPAGATVLSASVVFTADEPGGDPASLVLAGLAADDVPPFRWVAGDLSARPRTAATTEWQPGVWDVVGRRDAATTTPDLTAIVQEVVDRPGWTLGNALGLVVTGQGTRVAAALDSGDAARPELRVTYRPTTVPERTRLAVFGDYGIGCCNQARVASLVEVLRPDAIVTTGDNRYRPQIDTAMGRYHADWMGDYVGAHGDGSVTNRFFPAIGNHDYDDPGGLARHLDYVTLPGDGALSTYTSGTERYFDVLLGPVHLFVLNSDGREPDGTTADSEQAAWLRAQLAASPAPWQAVVLHHSPFSSGTEHGSTPRVQWPFAAWGADVVLSGNDHDYERIEHDGIPYLVTGAGGRSLYPFGELVAGSTVAYAEDYGTVLLEGCEHGMTFTFHGVSDGIVDTRHVGTPCSAPAAAVEPQLRTVTARPYSSADDAEESEAGWVDRASSDLELVAEPWGGNQLVGVRFPALDVPPGAKIADARVSFVADETDDGSPARLVVRAEAADDASWFDGEQYDVSSRPRTDAYLLWEPSSWVAGEAGAAQRSGYLADVVQEVVDRPGWEAGNALVLLVEGTGARVAEAVDSGRATAPVLEVTYWRP